MNSSPAITGRSCRPDSVGLSPRTTCWKSGRNVRPPNRANPTTRPTALVTVNTRLRNSDGGRIGSFARRSATTNAAMPTTAITPMRDDERRVPVVARPAERGREDERAQRGREQRGADVVDGVLDPLALAGQRHGQDAERDEAERHVDVEDPAPRRVRRQEAADERAGDARDAEDGAEQARPLAALARRHDVADRRLGGDHQAAAAEPLDRPEGDELRHALREPAEHRPDEEDHERSLQHDLAPVEVAELAVERRHDRHREQVRGDDPREVLEAAELADDRRQRGRHDRLVERRQQHHEHQPADDEEHRPAVGRPLGDRVDHGAHENESYCSGLVARAHPPLTRTAGPPGVHRGHRCGDRRPTAGVHG